MAVLDFTDCSFPSFLSEGILYTAVIEILPILSEFNGTMSNVS